MFNRKHNEIVRLKSKLDNMPDYAWVRSLYTIDKIKIKTPDNGLTYIVTVWKDGKKAVHRCRYEHVFWAIKHCIEKIDKYETIHRDVEVVK